MVPGVRRGQDVGVDNRTVGEAYAFDGCVWGVVDGAIDVLGRAVDEFDLGNGYSRRSGIGISGNEITADVGILAGDGSERGVDDDTGALEVARPTGQDALADADAVDAAGEGGLVRSRYRVNRAVDAFERDVGVVGVVGVGDQLVDA